MDWCENYCQRAADCDCGVPQSLAFPNITKISVSRDISDKPKTSHNHKLLLCVVLILFSQTLCCLILPATFCPFSHSKYQIEFHRNNE